MFKRFLKFLWNLKFALCYIYTYSEAICIMKHLQELYSMKKESSKEERIIVDTSAIIRIGTDMYS